MLPVLPVLVTRVTMLPVLVTRVTMLPGAARAGWYEGAGAKGGGPSSEATSGVRRPELPPYPPDRYSISPAIPRFLSIITIIMK